MWRKGFRVFYEPSSNISLYGKLRGGYKIRMMKGVKKKEREAEGETPKTLPPFGPSPTPFLTKLNGFC
jgi:hypothetical protein